MPLLERMRQILDTVTETTRDVEAVDEEVGNLLKTILEKRAAMVAALVRGIAEQGAVWWTLSKVAQILERYAYLSILEIKAE